MHVHLLKEKVQNQNVLKRVFLLKSCNPSYTSLGQFCMPNFSNYHGIENYIKAISVIVDGYTIVFQI